MKNSIFILFLLALIFSCGESKKENRLVEVTPASIAVGFGKVTPMGGVSKLASPVAGIVTDLKVSTGNHVNEGDTLIVLDDTDARLSVNELNSRYTAQVKMLESAQLLASQGQASVQEAKRKYEDANSLYKSGALSHDKLLTLTNEYEIAGINQLKLESDTKLQQAKLAEIDALRMQYMEELRRTVLLAPMNGTVLDILPRKGEALNKYDTYLLLAPDTPLVVMAEIDEMFSTRIAIGQTAEITLSGSTAVVATGRISRISPDLKKKSLFADSGQDFQDRRVREIEILLDDDTNMLIDTKVECIIDINN